VLVTNRKSHTRFRLVLKSTIIDNIEGPLRNVSKHVRLSEPASKISMKIYPYYQRRRCGSMTVDSGNIRFMRIFAVVLKIYVNSPQILCLRLYITYTRTSRFSLSSSTNLFMTVIYQYGCRGL